MWIVGILYLRWYFSNIIVYTFNKAYLIPDIIGSNWVSMQMSRVYYGKTNVITFISKQFWCKFVIVSQAVNQ